MATTSERRDEIEEFMLETLRELGVEDNTENRLLFLLGIKHAWDEDYDNEVLDFDARIERMFYRLALTGMITNLKLKLMFDRLLKDI